MNRAGCFAKGRTRVMVLCVLMLVAMMASMGIRPAHGQNWSPPQRLSQGEVKSWFPDVIADSMGKAHIVWSSHERVPPDTYDKVMYASIQDGRMQQPPTDIMAMFEPGLIQAATRPALFLGSNGTVYMSFRDEANIYFTAAPVSKAHTPQAWRPLYTVGSGYFSRVARDSQGRLHMVTTDNAPSLNCSLCFHVFYSRSDNDGKSWTPLNDISILPTGAAKPQLLIDDQDNVHLIWEAGVGGALGQLVNPTKVMYSASYDRGLTWSYPQALDENRSNSSDLQAKNPAIAFDRQGHLIAVWLGLPENVIYYQISTDRGKNWSAPVRVPGIWAGWGVIDARLDSYATATDSDGNVHLVAVGRPQEQMQNLGVYHLTWNGVEWSSPEAVMEPNAQSPQWPRIAVGLGNQLHVTWFMLNSDISNPDSERGYDVYYSSGIAKSKPLSAAPYPTLVPEKTPTPDLPTPQPTAQPQQVSQSVSTASREALTSEMDDVALIVLSLVPVALILAAFFLIKLFRRQ